MDISIVIKQSILFTHLVLFALALAAIVREDLSLIFSSKINMAALIETGRSIKWLLAGLWATGLILVIMDVGTDFALVLAKPKLLTKMIVVSALTLNGVLLHLIAFPMLTGEAASPQKAAMIATILGSISTTSWMYASFVGAARIIAPYFSLSQFMALYAIAVAFAISVGMLFVRDRMERLLTSARSNVPGVASDDENWDLVCREFDDAMSEFGRIRQQLGTRRDQAA